MPSKAARAVPLRTNPCMAGSIPSLFGRSWVAAREVLGRARAEGGPDKNPRQDVEWKVHAERDPRQSHEERGSSEQHRAQGPLSVGEERRKTGASSRVTAWKRRVVRCGKPKSTHPVERDARPRTSESVLRREDHQRGQRERHEESSHDLLGAGQERQRHDPKERVAPADHREDHHRGEPWKRR